MQDHPYKYPSKVILINTVNSTNGSRLNSQDVELTELQTLTDNANGYNTRVTLVARGESDYSLQQTVDYVRNDIGAVFADTGVSFKTNTGYTSDTFIKDINQTYGFKLTPRDVVYDVYNTDTLPTQITLVMADNCPAWIGSLTVALEKLKIDIATLGLNDPVAVFKYPTNQTAKGQGPLYSYRYDFTGNARYLIDLKVGDTPDPATLASILATATKDNWVASTDPAPLNTQAAGIQYNGVVNPTITARTDYDYVMALGVDSTLCTQLAGWLTIHYNKPAEPIPLPDVVTVTGLPVYSWPSPATSQFSGYYATINIDCGSIKTAIQDADNNEDSTGYPNSGVATKAESILAASFGLTGLKIDRNAKVFSSSPSQSYIPTNPADANPDFKYLVIFTLAADSTYGGKIYLGWN